MNLFDPKTKKLRELIKSRMEHGPKGCWNWTGALSTGGYARMSFKGKNSQAHRVAFFAWNGKIQTGLNILHDCDNRRCVNPMHIFAGTQKRNVQDCVKRGRWPSKSGAANGRAAITEAIAREIKTSPRNGRYFVRKYKLTDATVSKIRTGRTWRNV